MGRVQPIAILWVLIPCNMICSDVLEEGTVSMSMGPPLKMEAVCYSETPEQKNMLHGVQTQCM